MPGRWPRARPEAAAQDDGRRARHDPARASVHAAVWAGRQEAGRSAEPRRAWTYYSSLWHDLGVEQKRVTRAWKHVTSLALAVVVFVWVGMRLPGEPKGLLLLFHWLFLFFTVFALVVGHGVTGRWLALFTDARFKLSLSRLQSSFWSVFLLSEYMTASLANLASQEGSDLVGVPWGILAILGINAVSMLAAQVLLAGKKRTTPNQAERNRAIRLLSAQGHEHLDLEKPYGLVLRNSTPEAARWSDLVMGEEVGTAGSLDPFKLQSITISLLAAVAYYLSLFGYFQGEGPFTTLPSIPLALLILYGVSQFVYLAGKALPRSQEREPEPEIAPAIRAGLDTPIRAVEANCGVTLESMTLNNLRSFAKLDLNISPTSSVSEDDTGQLVLLLGDNGVGKSTILKGLTLALVDPAVATTLFGAQKDRAPFVRLGADIAEVRLRTSEALFRVAIRSKRGSERIEQLESGSRRPAVFAYGPQRGSALGRTARDVSFSEIGPVATLFHENAELIHAETWLIRLQASESRRGRAFSEAVQETLLGLLKPGVVRMRVAGEGVFLTGPDVGKDIPLSALSDGYLSAMGWILDFLARWSDRYERIEGEVPDRSMAAEAQGLVVIDEIGLHLHPQWQIHAVKNLREMFPRMTFVASTHQPLALLGAGPGEVYVLKRDKETGEVHVNQAEDPRLLTGTQLYAGFFEVDRLYPDDLGRKLDEYARLAVNPYRKDEEDERARNLLSELRSKQIDVELEPVDRILDRV